MGDRYVGKLHSWVGAPEIKKTDRILVRILVLSGIISMIFFIKWFVDPGHVGNGILFWILSAALFFKLLKMLHEWYHYWDVRVPQPPPLNRKFTVDMLTTACPGEPKEMILATLRAMVKVRYPHTNYLCDEGNDPELKSICESLGVVHVTRIEKIDAKAGNINNALKQASGEICVVLDPDHAPFPEFLDRVLPYFADEKVGYVQVVQAYGNQDDSFVALGAAQQTYTFYGPMMMCMGSYGTSQAIGANCTFRRAALDSIGGHAPGLSEDMHTAMRIHAEGWRSVYVPEILSRGLVPNTLPAYYSQQLKWARGTFDLLFRVVPRLFKKFTWRQKLHYLTLPLYFLFGLVNFFDFLVPVVALLMAETPWAVELDNFALLFLPLCGISLVIRLFSQRWMMEGHEKGLHLTGGLLRTGTWWIFLLGFIYTILNIKVPYIPTPKDDKPANNFLLCLPNIIVGLISIAAVIYGLSVDYNPYSIAMAGYAMLNVLILFIVTIASQQKTLTSIKEKISGIKMIKNSVDRIDLVSEKIRNLAFSVFRIGTVSVTFCVALLSLGWSYLDEPGVIEVPENTEKNNGLFFLITNEESQGFSENSVMVTLPFGKENLESSVKRIASGKSFPFIRFMMSETEAAKVAEGKLNGTIDSVITVFRKFPGCFITIDCSSENLGNAWEHIVYRFNEKGCGNQAWVWDADVVRSWPAEVTVDWIIGNEDCCFKFKKPFILKLKNTDNPGVRVRQRNRFPGGVYFPGPIHNKSESVPFLLPVDRKTSAGRILPDEYIRGVAYNPQHDWRDGNNPLTRKQLDRDFTRIREMGANVIRRYSPGMYDKNIFMLAEENDLKVLFGFFMDPEVDYMKDKKRLEKYERQILRAVSKYKDHPALLGWGLGNETYGLLKHHFSQPYLSQVRRAYVEFIQKMAEKVKEMDSEHFVFTAMEHSWQLGTEVGAFEKSAPSVDVFAVNSYYRQQISRVHEIVKTFTSRKYFISEFGPVGYWNEEFNLKSGGFTLEGDDHSKASWYREQWQKYIQAYRKEGNIGGVAYCWKDRMEGSLTWFGLSDVRGRLKPSYYALKDLWTGTCSDLDLKGPEIRQDKNWFYLPYEYDAEVAIYKDDYLEEIKDFTFSNGIIRIGDLSPGNYRLYVWIPDHGNSRCTSVPFRVSGSGVLSSSGEKTSHNISFR